MWAILLLLGSAGQLHAEEVTSPAGDGVTVGVESFGVGGVARPGGWTGICLRVGLAPGLQPRAVAVQLLIRDDDGDTMHAERGPITLSPGREQMVWIYVRTPSQMGPTNIFTVLVMELHESGQTGQRLSVARIAPSRLIEPTEQMIGVIGRRTLGIEQYELQAPARSASSHIGSSHEQVRVISGIQTSSNGFPDRWMGLSQFSTLLWTDGIPASLGTEGRAQALREWVHRGGHLVIVLPTVGGGWFVSDNPIADLLPDAAIRRVEDTSLEPYRRLLTDEEFAQEPLPTGVITHTFDIEQGTATVEATPVIIGPEGCVVARRIVGTGMVTVIGIDLGAVRYAGGQMLRADMFWHRMLGNRFDVPSPARAREEQSSGFPLGGVYELDSALAGAIMRSGAAGVGVLLAVIVFIAYWLIAGPAGYGILRLQGWARHTWIGFVFTVGVFTLIAWLGARSLRQTDFSMQHLTLLDHVYGQPVQRTTTWASVFLPEYSDETIRVGQAGLDSRWTQAACTWSDPFSLSDALSFPDARGYRVDSGMPMQLTVPSRATAKQFRFDWLGGPRWSMPRPVENIGIPLLDSHGEVTGGLVHDLPGDIQDVLFVLVEGQTLSVSDAPRESGELFAQIRFIGRPSWAPGEELNLSEIFATASESSGPLDRGAGFLRTLVEGLGTSGPLGFGSSSVMQRSRDVPRDMLRVALLPMLQPPAWGRPALQNVGRQSARVSRRETHGWDLGKWFTQPCLIIVGQLEVDSCPTPVFSARGGQERDIPTQGRTIIRWVYPLTPRPVSFGMVEGT